MRMINFPRYAALSFLGAGALVLHAFTTRRQFFPAMHYLATSKISLAALGNFGFVLSAICYKLITKIFLGRLRESEVERIYERINHGIMETCLAMTVFRHDFDTAFVACFVALGFVKVFHWVAQDRVNFMQTQPVITPLQHMRMSAFIVFLAVLDSFAMRETLDAALKGEASYQLLFAFEYVILASMVFACAVKYGFTLLDLALDRHWEARGLYTFYLELLMDMLHLVVYSIFFLVVFSKYGLPLHLVRDLYLSFANLRQRIGDFLRYRRVTAHIHLLEDASPEDGARAGGVCIICREDLGPTEPVKKLSCSHCFHLSCLRSWLERQQSCPTCRSPVFPAAPAAGAAAPGAAALRPAAAVPQGAAATATGAQPSPTAANVVHRGVTGGHSGTSAPSASAPSASTSSAASASTSAPPAAAPPCRGPSTQPPQHAPAASQQPQQSHGMLHMFGTQQHPFGYPPMSMAAFVPMAAPFQYAGQQGANESAPALMPMMPIIFPPPGYPFPGGFHTMLPMAQPNASSEQQAAAAAAAAAALAAVSAALAAPHSSAVVMQPPFQFQVHTPAPSVSASAAPSADTSSMQTEQASAGAQGTAAPPDVAPGGAFVRVGEVPDVGDTARLEALEALLGGAGSAQQQAASAAAASAAVAASVDATKQLLRTQMDLIRAQMERLDQAMPLQPQQHEGVQAAEQSASSACAAAASSSAQDAVPSAPVPFGSHALADPPSLKPSDEPGQE